MSHASALLGRAESERGDLELFACTDAYSIADTVLLAVARNTVSFVMAIAASEWDAVKCFHLLGFPDAIPPPQIVAAKKAKRAIKVKR